MSFKSEDYDREYWDSGKGSNYGSEGTAPYTEEYYLPAKREVALQIIQMLGIPDSIMCFGAGRGFQVLAFKQLGIDAYGIDISEYAIETAPASIKNRLGLGDISDNAFMMENFGTKSYQIITCFDVLEHIKVPELYNAILHAARMASQYVILNVPVKDTDDEPDESKTSTDKTHVSIYTPTWWLSTFAKIGRPFKLELQSCKVVHNDQTHSLFAIFVKRP